MTYRVSLPRRVAVAERIRKALLSTHDEGKNILSFPKDFPQTEKESRNRKIQCFSFSLAAFFFSPM